MPAVIFTLAYVGAANARRASAGERPFPFEVAVIAIIVLYGIVNMLANMLPGPAASSREYTVRMVVTGLLFGLMLSFIGAVLLDLPRKLFGFSDANRYLPLLIAPLVYALIWGIPINALNRFMYVAPLRVPRP